jgi:hypothetical protein
VDTKLFIKLKYLWRLRSGTQTSQPIAAINISIIKRNMLHIPLLQMEPTHQEQKSFLSMLFQCNYFYCHKLTWYKLNYLGRLQVLHTLNASIAYIFITELVGYGKSIIHNIFSDAFLLHLNKFSGCSPYAQGRCSNHSTLDPPLIPTYVRSWHV